VDVKLFCKVPEEKRKVADPGRAEKGTFIPRRPGLPALTARPAIKRLVSVIFGAIGAISTEAIINMFKRQVPNATRIGREVHFR